MPGVLMNSAFSSAGSPSAVGNGSTGHWQVVRRALSSRQIRKVTLGTPGSIEAQVGVRCRLPSYR